MRELLPTVPESDEFRRQNDGAWSGRAFEARGRLNPIQRSRDVGKVGLADLLFGISLAEKPRSGSVIVYVALKALKNRFLTGFSLTTLVGSTYRRVCKSVPVN